MLSLALAQAKFILSGEHFVVEGAPSVVLPASCFSTQVSLIDETGDAITACCVFEGDQPVDPAQKTAYEQVVVRLIRLAADILGIDLGGLHMSGVGLRCIVKSTIPPGQGAGSSSALCQAIVEVMLKHFYSDDVHANYLKWYGTQLEIAWHGKVSGIDNAAVAYRRILLYQRGAAPEPLEVGCPLYFVVGSTGDRSPLSPYQRFRYYKEMQPVQFASFRKVSSENALHLADAIRMGDVGQIGALMNESHDLFNAIGIVTPQMNAAVEEARNLKAYGARMTGAGGGGFVIACVPIHAIESVQQSWMKMGLNSIRGLQFGDVPRMG